MQSIEPAVALRWADMAGELAGVGYWWMDAATQAIRWSPNMFKIFGMSPDVAPSLDSAMQFIHADDRPLADSNLESNLLGSSMPTATRIVRPSGEIRYIEGRNACEFGPAGEVLAIYGTVHDVTDRRVAELALAESEARYRLLADAASDVILRVSANQVIEYVSPSIRQYGWSPEEMVGKIAANFIHTDDVDRVLRSVASKDHTPLRNRAAITAIACSKLTTATSGSRPTQVWCASRTARSWPMYASFATSPSAGQRPRRLLRARRATGSLRRMSAR